MNPGGTGNPSDEHSESFSDLRSDVKTAGDLLSGIAQDVSRLVRLEIELAKQEIVELARTKAVAGGLGALGLVLGLMVIPFFLLTVFEVLSLRMPRWAASLLMTLLITAACGGVFLLARKKFDGSVLPERTVRSLKETFAWAKRLKR